MSITVKLWEKDELKKAQEDEWLATLLMNKSTFDKKEMIAYNTLPFPTRTFFLWWDNADGSDDEVVIKAPNLRMMQQFIETEYNIEPDGIIERITDYKTIK